MITVIIIDVMLLILTAYFNIICIYLDQNNKQKYNQKIEDSLKIIEKDGFKLHIIEYPVKTLIKIEGNGKLSLDDIKIIDIKEKTIIDELTIDNLKVIKNFNLIINHLEINNSNYKVKDSAIFDRYDNLRFFYNHKAKKELIYYAMEYSISPYALKYFTDASYFQFSKKRKTKELRVSNPYSKKDDECYVIIPKMVNHMEINIFELNIPCVSFMYICEGLKIIRLEKKSSFKHIIIDKNNHSFMIRNKALVYKKTKSYIRFGYDVFKSISQDNKLEESYKVKYRFKKIHFYKEG